MWQLYLMNLRPAARDGLVFGLLVGASLPVLMKNLPGSTLLIPFNPSDESLIWLIALLLFAYWQGQRTFSRQHWHASWPFFLMLPHRLWALWLAWTLARCSGILLVLTGITIFRFEAITNFPFLVIITNLILLPITILILSTTIALLQSMGRRQLYVSILFIPFIYFTVLVESVGSTQPLFAAGTTHSLIWSLSGGPKGIEQSISMTIAENAAAHMGVVLLFNLQLLCLISYLCMRQKIFRSQQQSQTASFVLIGSIIFWTAFQSLPSIKAWNWWMTGQITGAQRLGNYRIDHDGTTLLALEKNLGRIAYETNLFDLGSGTVRRSWLTLGVLGPHKTIFANGEHLHFSQVDTSTHRIWAPNSPLLKIHTINRHGDVTHQTTADTFGVTGQKFYVARRVFFDSFPNYSGRYGAVHIQLITPANGEVQNFGSFPKDQPRNPYRMFLKSPRIITCSNDLLIGYSQETPIFALSTNKATQTGTQIELPKPLHGAAQTYWLETLGKPQPMEKGRRGFYLPLSYPTHCPISKYELETPIYASIPPGNRDIHFYHYQPGSNAKWHLLAALDIDQLFRPEDEEPYMAFNIAHKLEELKPWEVEQYKSEQEDSERTWLELEHEAQQMLLAPGNPLESEWINVLPSDELSAFPKVRLPGIRIWRHTAEGVLGAHRAPDGVIVWRIDRQEGQFEELARFETGSPFGAMEVQVTDGTAFVPMADIPSQQWRLFEVGPSPTRILNLGSEEVSLRETHELAFVYDDDSRLWMPKIDTAGCRAWRFDREGLPIYWLELC